MISKKSKRKCGFNLQAFLESAGVTRRVVEFQRKEGIFSQGDAAESVMDIQKGRR
jgi:hypothetical protein